MKVFYGEKQVVENTGQTSYPNLISPSARKPKELAQKLQGWPGIEFVEPSPLTIDDFKLAHLPSYVDGVMSLQIENGFGSKSQAVADSLPYTNGAMYDAARAATASSPTCALVSGFHHAGFEGQDPAYLFCTFNGLMITAVKLLAEGHAKRVSIIDADMHWGNGTDDILSRMMPEIGGKVQHITFGRFFTGPEDAHYYMEWLLPNRYVEKSLQTHKPDVILYQAGADVHVEDPAGGVLTTQEMFLRDYRIFTIAQKLRIPIAWNLAGGYQIEADGSIDKVLELHLNTFRACQQVYDECNITLQSDP